MAYRLLSSLPAVFGPSSLCTAWLQRSALGPATYWAADSAAWRSVATARSGDETVAARTEGLPPPWEPPPHNPKSLKPKPAPTLPEILTRIRQATTAVEVHNAYRRNSRCVPPLIATAMFTRLSQLIAAPAASSAQPPQQQPGDTGSASTSAGAARLQARERGQGALLTEIRRSWNVFLHLIPAKQLAALVRASCETGLLLQPERSVAATAAGAAGSPAPGGGWDRGLVQRSLDVLLDAGGRELQEAGPQAVLDVSYGLMLAGRDDAATWRTLGPLLRAAKAELRGDRAAAGTEGSAAELAAKVLKWAEQRGLKA